MKTKNVILPLTTGESANTDNPSELVFQLRIQLDLQAKILMMLKSTFITATLKSTFTHTMLPHKCIKRIRKHLTSTRHMFVRAKACLMMKLKLLKKKRTRLKKTLKQTLLQWRPSQNQLTAPSVEGNSNIDVPVEKIKRTFTATTQNAASIVCGPKANQTLKSPNPALNIRRRKEAVATDSPFADVPAVNAPGCAGAQMFVGRSSLLTDCYGFCSASEFPNTLLDNIRERGAMDTLTSDHANYKMPARVKDIL